jgi:hypothetical protein
MNYLSIALALHSKIIIAFNMEVEMGYDTIIPTYDQPKGTKTPLFKENDKASTTLSPLHIVS